MRSTYVADVGDGLCMAVESIFGEIIQIDCGSQEGNKVAFNGWEKIINHFYTPDVFILSHFHIDHYNGLLYASINRHRYPLSGIRKVYYPRIPEFEEKEEFVCDLLAMNMKVFGAETGVMEYEFLEAISRINRMPFKYESLSKGDTININGSNFEVLWPPPVIDRKKTLNVINQAIGDFEIAKKEDEETNRLYKRVKEESIFRDYFREQGKRNEFKEYYNGYINIEYKRRKLPKVVEKANNSLRKAANHLSLAFFEDNRFLFLGDIENFEIKQIIKNLKSKGRENFYIFITPHHGTHWNKCLNGIKCIYSVTSNGKKLCSKMKIDFKKISKRSLATYVNGDIVIPIYSKEQSWPILPCWFY